MISNIYFGMGIVTTVAVYLFLAFRTPGRTMTLDRGVSLVAILIGFGWWFTLPIIALVLLVRKILDAIRSREDKE